MHESQHPATRGQIALGLGIVYVAWGSTYLAIGMAVSTIPPYLMAAIRFLVAGGILYAIARMRGAAPPTRVHWKSTLIIGALLLVFGNGSVCLAERVVPSGLTALMIATTPLWMVLMDWLIFGASRPTKRVACGIGIGFVGAVILVTPSTLAGSGQVNPLGALALVVATVSWAGGSLYARRAVLPANPLLVTAMEMLTGGVILVILSGIIGEWNGLTHLQIPARSLLALGYLIVVGSLIGFSAYVWVLHAAPITVVSTYAYVNPLVAVVLGAAIGGEKITSRTLLAGAAILTAVVMIISRAQAPKAQAAEPA